MPQKTYFTTSFNLSPSVYEYSHVPSRKTNRVRAGTVAILALAAVVFVLSLSGSEPSSSQASFLAARPVPAPGRVQVGKGLKLNPPRGYQVVRPPVVPKPNILPPTFRRNKERRKVALNALSRDTLPSMAFETSPSFKDYVQRQHEIEMLISSANQAAEAGNVEKILKVQAQIQQKKGRDVSRVYASLRAQEGLAQDRENYLEAKRLREEAEKIRPYLPKYTLGGLWTATFQGEDFSALDMVVDLDSDELTGYVHGQIPSIVAKFGLLEEVPEKAGQIPGHILVDIKWNGSPPFQMASTASKNAKWVKAMLYVSEDEKAQMVIYVDDVPYMVSMKKEMDKVSGIQ